MTKKPLAPETPKDLKYTNIEGKLEIKMADNCLSIPQQQHLKGLLTNFVYMKFFRVSTKETFFIKGPSQ